MSRPSHWGNPKGDPENVDTTPIEMPLGAMRPTPLQDIVARMVREAVESEKGDEFETFEESNDFEEEDPDVMDFTPYEMTAMQDEHYFQDADAHREQEQQQRSPDPEEDPPAPPTGDPPDPNAEETE